MESHGPPNPDERWLSRRTLRPTSLSLEDLVELKRRRSQTVSVCLPALNEEHTIGHICEVVSRRLVESGLVDELVVVDSGSSDATVARAEDAGADVYRVADLPHPGDARVLGKGDALWRSLSVMTGDVIVWVDSDTRNFSESFVIELVAPLLADIEISFVKAFYDRPIQGDQGMLRTGGARITEIALRPLLQIFYPELTGFVQPLSGEYAIRADLARALPFLTGYAVEVGLLIDIFNRLGLDAMCQVDLGMRVHRNRDVLALGRASFQVIQGLLLRAEAGGRIKIPDELPTQLVQFNSSEEGPRPEAWELEVHERPAIVSLGL